MPRICYVEKSFNDEHLSKHGRSSWELDALDPATLDALIQAQIDQWRDDSLWAADTTVMEQQRSLLTAVSEQWDDVAAFVGESE
ncbi:hypothetical protein [Nonomuraea sp. NPDC005650]|uniref:hypothetical protein n=1 Tax=Nonomuraea sp. NPDC005650 TaxID=3157045 RepID=UPI0033BB3CF0